MCKCKFHLAYIHLCKYVGNEDGLPSSKLLNCLSSIPSRECATHMKETEGSTTLTAKIFLLISQHLFYMFQLQNVFLKFFEHMRCLSKICNTHTGKAGGSLPPAKTPSIPLRPVGSGPSQAAGVGRKVAAWPKRGSEWLVNDRFKTPTPPLKTSVHPFLKDVHKSKLVKRPMTGSCFVDKYCTRRS